MYMLVLIVQFSIWGENGELEKFKMYTVMNFKEYRAQEGRKRVELKKGLWTVKFTDLEFTYADYFYWFIYFIREISILILSY